jgi:hypothetical protein
MKGRSEKTSRSVKAMTVKLKQANWKNSVSGKRKQVGGTESGPRRFSIHQGTILSTEMGRRPVLVLEKTLVPGGTES